MLVTCCCEGILHRNKLKEEGGSAASRWVGTRWLQQLGPWGWQDPEEQLVHTLP